MVDKLLPHLFFVKKLWVVIYYTVNHIHATLQLLAIMRVDFSQRKVYFFSFEKD